MTRYQWQNFLLISVVWFALIVLVHYQLDFNVTQAVHHVIDPRGSIVHVAQYVADMGLGLPYLIGFGVLFVFARFIAHKRELSLNTFYLLLCVAVSGLICDGLKLVFGRPRPVLWFGHQLTHFVFLGHREFAANDYMSFPSGHATTAGAVAVGVMLLLPRWRMLCILFMVAIAAARVLLLRHYCADVMAGLYLGAATSYVLHQYLRQGYTLGVVPA